jgi:hypothetical protein
MHAELLAAKSVEAMRQEAHAREVADMQVRSLGWGVGAGVGAAGGEPAVELSKAKMGR